MKNLDYKLEKWRFMHQSLFNGGYIDELEIDRNITTGLEVAYKLIKLRPSYLKDFA